MNGRSTSRLAALSAVCFLLFLAIIYGLTSNGALRDLLTRIDAVFVRQAFYFDPPAVLVWFMLVMTSLANPAIIIAFEVLVSIVLLTIHRRSLAAFFVAGLAAGEALTHIFKVIIERARPSGALYQVSQFGYSFPSGHALAAMIFYGFAGYSLAHAAEKLWQKRLIAAASVLTVFLIGYSRLFFGVHWFSDVLGGWLLGGAILIFLILGYDRAKKRKAAAVTASPANRSSNNPIN